MIGEIATMNAIGAKGKSMKVVTIMDGEMEAETMGVEMDGDIISMEIMTITGMATGMEEMIKKIHK